MQNIQNNLIKYLTNVVGKEQQKEIHEIIVSMSDINIFKYELFHTDDLDTIYKKIKTLFKTKFNISNYKVIYGVNNIETTEYPIMEIERPKYSYDFKNNISSNRYITISLDTVELNEFQMICLNSYLEDITNILYVRFIVKELQSTVYIDPLTQLKNRISFQEEMKDLIPLALREKMKIGVLLINIDRFRAVNDEHGTKFGDEFLKLYANTINHFIRSSDLAIRFSGGEFLVLLMNIIDEHKTIELANALKERLAETYLITPNNDKFKKTVCIGVSMFPDDSNDINEIIKKAELALSDARDQGRNKVLRFEEDNGEIDFF